MKLSLKFGVSQLGFSTETIDRKRKTHLPRSFLEYTVLLLGTHPLIKTFFTESVGKEIFFFFGKQSPQLLTNTYTFQESLKLFFTMACSNKGHNAEKN